MAQQLDLPSGRLSELLSGRRDLTPAAALKIATKLSYDPAKRQKFLELVEAKRTRAAQPEPMSHEKYLQLSADAFYVLSDWHHFAILSLIDLDDFDPAPSAIAKRLGLSTIEVRGSLERLTRLGLVTQDKLGNIKKTSKNITTTHDVESAALKLSHKQNLELAAQALDEVGVEMRDITSITMAIDVEKLPLAKQMIKKFRRQLSEFMESGSKNEVYNLNVQLFPLSKTRTKDRKK